MKQNHLFGRKRMPERVAPIQPVLQELTRSSGSNVARMAGFELRSAVMESAAAEAAGETHHELALRNTSPHSADQHSSGGRETLPRHLPAALEFPVAPELYQNNPGEFVQQYHVPWPIAAALAATERSTGEIPRPLGERLQHEEKKTRLSASPKMQLTAGPAWFLKGRLASFAKEGPDIAWVLRDGHWYVSFRNGPGRGPEPVDPDRKEIDFFPSPNVFP